jgi:hypothetical protein
MNYAQILQRLMREHIYSSTEDNFYLRYSGKYFSVTPTNEEFARGFIKGTGYRIIF